MSFGPLEEDDDDAVLLLVGSPQEVDALLGDARGLLGLHGLTLGLASLLIWPVTRAMWYHLKRVY